MGSRDHDEQDTREAIIRAGIELFAERGYRATKLREITAAAGLSESAFFIRFRWKEDLLLEESRNVAQLFADALDTRCDDEPTIDVLERALRSFRKAHEEPEALRLSRLRYQVIAAESELREPELIEFAERIRPPIAAGYLSDLRRAGVGDAEPYARILTGLTVGGLTEEMSVYRIGVLRGTLSEDLPQLAFLQAAIFTNIRNAIRTFSSANR